MKKPWHLNRRTFLRGTGVTLALPFLDCMAENGKAAKSGQAKRMCAVYFPYGAAMPKRTAKMLTGTGLLIEKGVILNSMRVSNLSSRFAIRSRF